MTTPASPRPQRGFTMIDALVALLVAALGVLGIVGVQMRTLADTQTGVRRAQAVRLIEDLGERLRVHPNALSVLGSFTSGFDDLPVPGDCASGCDQSALISYDIGTWKTDVQNQLPLGRASIFIAPGEAGVTDNRRLLGVILAWRENERADTDEDFRAAIDTVAADGSTDSANECPEGFTCHLQYIPVAARCAPYFAGSSTTAQYFCPGS